MIVGVVFRLLLLVTILKAFMAEGEEKKMRTAFAASIAGIHGAVMNLTMMQSIRADIGDLLLVFGEYKGFRTLRYMGFATIEFYLVLAGTLTLGLVSYYVIGMSMMVVPIRVIKKRKNPRLIFPPYRSLL